MRLHPRNRSAGERGSILIWVALFMVVMLAFVALGVDGAKLLATRTQLQNAADAGALAGASAVNPTTGVIDQARATSLAQATAASNKAFIGGVRPVLDAVVTFPTATQCRVDVTRSGGTAIVTHIAQVVGVNSLSANATATAGLERPECVSGVVPLGVGNASVPFEYVKGQEYTLVEGIGTGNYQYLDFSGFPCEEGPCGGSSGASDLACQIKYGFGCCFPIGQDVPVKTGVNTGPVRSAIDYRFNQETVSGYDHQYPKTTSNTYPDYLAHSGNGMRLVVVPLVVFTTAPGNNKRAHVNGYASFFLKRRLDNKKEYYGEYVQDVVIGEGSGGNGTVFTLKLVQ